MPTGIPIIDAHATTTSRDVLDSVRMPMFVLQSNRVILHANLAGLATLESDEWLVRVRNTIACRDGDSHHALEHGLREVASRRSTRHVLGIRRDGASIVAAVLSRVQRRDSLVEHPDAVLFAIPGMGSSQPDPEAISIAFQLTPAEARIAAVIGAGKTPQECAAILKVKVSTIRSQLASVYRKTGTGSQAHLARLMMPLTLF